MFGPGVDTVFPQYYPLFKSVDNLAMLMDKETDIATTLVTPLVLTRYSAFECFLTNIEDRILKDPELKDFYSNSERPKMETRPFVLFKIIKNKPFDKSSKLYDDYNHFVKLRNLIAHSRLESIEWINFEVKNSEKISIQPSHVNKKEMWKVSNDATVERDDKADKIISFFERRKIIDIQSEFRMQGYIYCIEKVEIAKWADDMITELMKHFDEDRRSVFFQK